MMPECAYCGEPLYSWNQRHTHDDCITYLREHPEGGKLFEKLGGRKHFQDSLFSLASKGERTQ